VLLIYVDDGIICGADAADIQTVIDELGALFDITDEGEIDAYLGVKISIGHLLRLLNLLNPI
jgi:hypothetical protein